MKVVKSVLIFAVILILASCASMQTLQDQWAKMTPDEKSRVILDGMQRQLNTLWDTGSSYIAANPQYKDQWKAKIVPAFDTANKMLRQAMDTASKGGMTPQNVYAIVQGSINQVLQLLSQIGMKI